MNELEVLRKLREVFKVIIGKIEIYSSRISCLNWGFKKKSNLVNDRSRV